MHIDLNSCFAIIEQQANPLIRHKPVAIAAYNSPKGAILASSYEAKALGIKLMINVREAKMLYKDIIILTPDPEKYFDAHRRFKNVLLNYTDQVTPKSVDEFVIDFHDSRLIHQSLSLHEIGKRIKQDIKESLGEYVTVNIGIGPNRFLAKLAAGLNKPDGLDTIQSTNLRTIYNHLELDDLPGINKRYRARLNLAGIYTPLQFLDASAHQLKSEVFHSITGVYWYLRLRGHEIDTISFNRKSFGQQYALGDKTTDLEKLSRLLMKLSEKTGRRMRQQNYHAYGIHLWLTFENRVYWTKSQKTQAALYSTRDIYLQAVRLLYQVVIPARVTNLGVTVFNLEQVTPQQLGLFDNTSLDSHSLATATDLINDKYGEFTITPALMANMQSIILKRVAYGSIQDS